MYFIAYFFNWHASLNGPRHLFTSQTRLCIPSIATHALAHPPDCHRLLWGPPATALWPVWGALPWAVLSRLSCNSQAQWVSTHRLGNRGGAPLSSPFQAIGSHVNRALLTEGMQVQCHAYISRRNLRGP